MCYNAYHVYCLGGVRTVYLVVFVVGGVEPWLPDVNTHSSCLILTNRDKKKSWGVRVRSFGVGRHTGISSFYPRLIFGTFHHGVCVGKRAALLFIDVTESKRAAYAVV